MKLNALYHRRHLLTLLLASSCTATLPFGRIHALDTLKPLSLPSPNTPIEDSTGTAVMLSDYRPTPLLVNFWASWCAPCIHELPALQRLNTALNAENMAVALVGIDRQGREFGTEFLANHDITIPLALYDAGGKLAQALAIRAMPTSFLIAGTGTIVGKVEGPLQWDDPQIISQTIAHLS